MAGDGWERVLSRDRAIVSAALAATTVLAWIYIARLAAQMDMGGMDMTGFRMALTTAGMVMTPDTRPWIAGEFVLTFAMWAVMMIGMMLPSAAPMILLYARVGRQAGAQGQPFASTGWFAGGYLAAWAAFSIVATLGQWLLDRAALLTPTMQTTSGVLGAAAFIAAGIYQWTPFKNQCLTHCQTPIRFLQRHGGFRRDAAGALLIGAHHGLFCVGCCWALMALLFAGGVMNVLWIALIALLVLVEKLVPSPIVPRAIGVLFLAAGVFVLLARW